MSLEILCEYHVIHANNRKWTNALSHPNPFRAMSIECDRIQFDSLQMHRLILHTAQIFDAMLRRTIPYASSYRCLFICECNCGNKQINVFVLSQMNLNSHEETKRSQIIHADDKALTKSFVEAKRGEWFFTSAHRNGFTFTLSLYFGVVVVVVVTVALVPSHTLLARFLVCVLLRVGLVNAYMCIAFHLIINQMFGTKHEGRRCFTLPLLRLLIPRPWWHCITIVYL